MFGNHLNYSLETKLIVAVSESPEKTFDLKDLGHGTLNSLDHVQNRL